MRPKLEVCIALLFLAGAVLSTSSEGENCSHWQDFRLIPGTTGYALSFVKSLPSKELRFLTYLLRVEVKDDDTTCRIIDSVVSSSAVELCDSATLYYIEQRDNCFYLVTMALSGSVARDTVMYHCLPVCPYLTIYSYFFRNSDSLLGFTFFTYSREDSPWKGLIARVRPGNVLDTITFLRDATSCSLSPDGTEVFVEFDHWRQTAGEHGYNTGVFDLLSESLLVPLNGSHTARNAFRLTRDSPLYYIKTDSLWGTNVWRWFGPYREERVTYFMKSEWVSSFTVSRDSIACVLGSSEPQPIDKAKTVVLPLGSPNSRQ